VGDYRSIFLDVLAVDIAADACCHFSIIVIPWQNLAYARPVRTRQRLRERVATAGEPPAASHRVRLDPETGAVLTIRQ
jgi:hypothetical protein